MKVLIALRFTVRHVTSLILLALLAATAGSQAAAPTAKITVIPDAVFQEMFESYGNDNTLLDDWTGSDGTLSVLLPDGRVLWDFSDTFLGLVNSDGSRPGG